MNDIVDNHGIVDINSDILYIDLDKFNANNFLDGVFKNRDESFRKICFGDPPITTTHDKFDGLRDGKDASPKLRKIYFYYVKFGNDNKLLCKHYSFPVTGTSGSHIRNSVMKNKVTAFGCDALNQGINCKNSDGFENIEWECPSYLVFCLDEENWVPHYKGNTLDSLHFTHNKIVNLRGFKNAEVFDAKCKVNNKPKKLTMIVCENFHYKAGSTEPRKKGDNPDEYKFNMLFDIEICARGNSRKETIIIDPTGLNIGP